MAYLQLLFDTIAEHKEKIESFCNHYGLELSFIFTILIMILMAVFLMNVTGAVITIFLGIFYMSILGRSIIHDIERIRNDA